MIWTKRGISRKGTIRRNAFRILTAGLAILAGIASSLATTYDLSRDFSPTDNPNGVWTFGAKASLDGQLQPFTIRGITPAGAVPIQYWQLVPNQEPTIYRNGTTGTATVGDQLTLPPGVVWMFGGPSSSPNEFGTIRFTVPLGGSGNYRIETDVRPIYDGNIQGDTDFHVVRNGTELFGRFLAPPDRSGYTNTLLLGAGDTIDFLVGRGQDDNNSASGLKLKARLIKNDPPSPPAGSIPIANHSFEDPPVSDGQYTINEMPGWIGSGPWFHVANPADDWFAGTSAGSSLPNPIDGLNIAGINTGAWIYQDLAAVVQPGATYTLTMLTGHRIGSPFGRPTVSLLAGGQVLAQAIPDAPVESRFSSFQLTYSSPASGSMVGQPLRIEIRSAGVDAQPWFDNLNLTVVPTAPQPTNCPVPTGLVSWWRGEGNAEDSAGSNDGELRNGAAFAPGMVGQGFRFNGLGSYVHIPHTPSLNFSSEITVELWYKYEGADVAYGLVAARGTETGPVNFGISVIPTGLGLYFNDPTVANGDDADHGGAFEASRYLPVPASGVFHHLATTCRQISPTNVEVTTYVNGQLVKTKTIAASLARTLSDAPITIGRSAEYGGEFFDGVIDEVSIYNRALAASEIQAIHLAGSAGKCAPTNHPPVNHAPVAKATVGPLFNLWTDETTLLVIAGNGMHAEVKLDGSMSSDSDGDALEYVWTEIGQATPLAAGVLATNSFELGEHAILLLVDDGRATGHDAITIEVITLSEAVEELLLFVSETDLSRNEKRPLLATLNRVWDSFDEGDLRSGVKQLGALQQKTRAHLLKAKPEAGRKLIDAADQIIDVATAAMDDDGESKHHGGTRR